jgi:transcription-repair coupling factor (superfamily II helicase)
MNERALEKIVSAFRDGEYDLLLSTTIVESGLDIPNANTMFVNRSDAFGLSDLYQLRGRIGRSRHRAYAYFLIPREGSLSGAARKRIEVIRDFAHLGAGFQIALYDLEIRGAGSVLGYRQSGHIANLGFDLYTKLLRETIRELQGEPAVEEHPVKISLSLPTFIPDDYMESINKRLSFYKRIADASSEEDLEAVAGEMRERFGALPGPVHSLLQAARLKISAEQAGLASLTWSAGGLEIAFHSGSAVSGEKIVAALQASPPGSRMRGEDRFYRAWEAEGTDDRFAEALALLQSLG